MIMREGGCWHDRAENDVEFAKQLAPALSEPSTRTVGLHPVAMAQDQAAHAFARQARVARGDRFGHILEARIDVLGHVGAEDR